MHNVCTRFTDDGSTQKIQTILQNAEEKQRLILAEAHTVLEKQLAQNHAILNHELQTKQLEIQQLKQALSAQQSHIDQYNNNIHNQEKALSQSDALIRANQNLFTTKTYEFQQIKGNFETALERVSSSSKKEISADIKDIFLKEHVMEVSRLTFERQEQLKHEAQKLAQRALQSVYYRYQPRFVWPKSSFIFECTNPLFIEKYFSENSPILKVLLENTDTTLSVLETSTQNEFFVKIAGGLGVDKEIIRLTLEECRTKKLLNADKIPAIRHKYQTILEQQILHMGDEGAKFLGLKKMHPEILKLIGSLNFRTSHRQNQYYHSLEVATLAGMIADELGVDSTLAKRSGLLHDIGKVLDYKIEGSHAVISGDYAAKYHEHESVVDTVLSHHDDKILETPHAFILKAADAMSGARPGARVDMEGGYNRRLDGISAVVQSFQDAGVTHSAIMHAGREVHVYVDTKKTPHTQIDTLAQDIAAKLESDVEYPGQIRVTVIRRMEITAVA